MIVIHRCHSLKTRHRLLDSLTIYNMDANVPEIWHGNKIAEIPHYSSWTYAGSVILLKAECLVDCSLVLLTVL